MFFGINKKLLAFTLAEVLITLGIIGVIAALTIPSLIQNTQKKEYVVGLKEAFSILTNATNSLITDNGGTMQGVFQNGDSYNPNNSPRPAEVYAQKLNVQKVCTLKTDLSCFHDTINDLAGYDQDGYTVNSNEGGLILKNGMRLTFTGEIAGNCDHSYYFTETNGEKTACAEIWVDVNGSKEPNILGRDIFSLLVTKYRLIPFGMAGSAFTNCAITGIHQSRACGYRVLTDEAMNY